MARRKTNVCDELLLNKVVLRPDKAHARLPGSLGRPFEPFTARSEYNGRAISGWYFPTEQPKAVALINSSNRGTKAEALDHAAMLLDCSCSLLLYDYQGFGDSEGLADVRTLVGDARGVLEWARLRGVLKEREQPWSCNGAGPCHPERAQDHAARSVTLQTLADKPPVAPINSYGKSIAADNAAMAPGRSTPANSAGVAPESVALGSPLLVVGLSLGSLVAVRLAADPLPVCALVLDGAVEPFRALRRSFGPLGAVVAEVACSQVPDDLNSEKHIRSVTCPTLFVHGRNDDISTVEDAAYLAGRSQHASLWVLDNCGHLDIITRHRNEYRRRVEPLLTKPAVR
jgi:pimeloyl-ACP methyl ester carboxylesterase